MRPMDVHSYLYPMSVTAYQRDPASAATAPYPYDDPTMAGCGCPPMAPPQGHMGFVGDLFNAIGDAFDRAQDTAEDVGDIIDSGQDIAERWRRADPNAPSDVLVTLDRFDPRVTTLAEAEAARNRSRARTTTVAKVAIPVALVAVGLYLASQG